MFEHDREVNLTAFDCIPTYHNSGQPERVII